MRLSHPLVAALALLSCSICAPVAASVEWSRLNATTIAAVPAAEFVSLTAEQFLTVSPYACTGIQEAQLRNTGINTGGNGSACAGMPNWCMVGITADAIPGLQAECLLSIPAAKFDVSQSAMPSLPLALMAQMSPAQFHHITLGSLEVLTAAQLAELSVPVCAAMGDFAINMLEDGTVATNPPLCSGFTSACVSALPPASLDSVHGLCLAHMQPSVLAVLSGNQSLKIPSDALSWLLPSVTAAFSADFCGGLSGNALDWMSTETMSELGILGLSPTCFGALTADACADSDAAWWIHLFTSPGNATRLSALTPACVGSLDCAAWRAMDTEADLELVRAALNREGSEALAGRCAPKPLPDGGKHDALTLPLAIGGAAALLIASVIAVIYIRRRNSNRQALAQQSHGTYSSMP